MAPEILAAVQALLDIAVDVKKGMKNGGVLAALLADADLMKKLEIVASNLGSMGSDIKAVSAADIVPLLQVVIPGIEAVIAA